MFHVVVFVISWIVWLIFADKKRWRELFPVCFFASFLGCFSDTLMQFYPLWQYQGGHPILMHSCDDLGVYVVVTYLFIQWLPKKQTFRNMVVYWFVWTAAAISLEMIYSRTEMLVYRQWWSVWCSYLTDWLLFGVFYSYHRLFRFEILSRQS